MSKTINASYTVYQRAADWSGEIDRHIGSLVAEKCVSFTSAKRRIWQDMLHRKNRKFTRTLTPPLGDEETARSLSDWLLGGQRLAASRTDGRTPLGYRSDAGRMSRDRTSRRMTHRRSDERIRVGILVAYPTVGCLQTSRGGRSFRAPSPRLRRCQAYRLHVAVRGCALLATDSHKRPEIAGQSVTA